MEPEDKCSFVITGNTWAFRQRLDAHGVSLGYTGENEARKYMSPQTNSIYMCPPSIIRNTSISIVWYYRVLKSLDMTNSEQRQRVLDMLGEAVFKNLAMRATVDKTPDEGSDTADFIEELKELSNLHFKATTPSTTTEPAATQVDGAADKTTTEA